MYSDMAKKTKKNEESKCENAPAAVFDYSDLLLFDNCPGSTAEASKPFPAMDSQQVENQPGVSGQIAKQPIRVKRAIHFMLDESSADDLAWVQKQETLNSKIILDSVVPLVSWQIVGDKKVTVDFKLSTGEFWIILEQHPNKHGRFTGLQMTQVQWLELKSQFDVILAYVKAAENGSSWKTMAKFNRHNYEEDSGPAYKRQRTEEEATQEGFYCQQVRFLVADENIYVTLKSTDPNNQGGCQVDIRKCIPPRQGNNKTGWIYLLSGLTLVSGSFHYLVKYLSPKIQVAMNLCEAIYYAGHGYQAVCAEIHQ
jgi:hypothetical protein